VKTFTARTQAQWRDWLRAHHQSEAEVWLVFHKRHTGISSVEYKDALDEALCFGWIDSLIKRLDESRYARKFTPRKEDSRWSAINRKRWAELKAAGRLQPAGLRRAPGDDSDDSKPVIAPGIQDGILAALRGHPAAFRCFEKLPPSHRRRYVGWIVSARREETRARRLGEAIRMLTAGKPLGLK
jgi:uncharacterized protein YdeI (YjbR/CyaY-like superfamily)